MADMAFDCKTGFSFVWKVLGDYSIVHSAVGLDAEVLPVVTVESTPVYIHMMQQILAVS